MKTILFASAILFGFEQGSTYLLDLLNVQRSTWEEYRAIPITNLLIVAPPPARATHGPPPPPPIPFEVTGLLFDRTAYLIGDRFQCQLILRYAGASPIKFPVSSQAHLFRRSMPSAHAAAISIGTDDDPHVGSQLLLVESLYGSDSVSGSLITLAPGQTVEIHAAGSLYFRSANPKLESLAWPVVVTPRARLTFSNSSGEYANATSVDNQSITLARRE